MEITEEIMHIGENIITYFERLYVISEYETTFYEMGKNEHILEIIFNCSFTASYNVENRKLIRIDYNDKREDMTLSFHRYFKIKKILK